MTLNLKEQITLKTFLVRRFFHIKEHRLALTLCRRATLRHVRWMFLFQTRKVLSQWLLAKFFMCT